MLPAGQRVGDSWRSWLEHPELWELRGDMELSPGLLGDGTAMLLLACVLPALGKGTGVTLNNKSAPA